MKEYAILSFIFALFTLIVERRTGFNLFMKATFYIFLITILFFKFLVNGYLTGRGIVIYNPRFFLGIRIGSIPMEDFLFGFSMVTMTIILWEYFKKNK